MSAPSEADGELPILKILKELGFVYSEENRAWMHSEYGTGFTSQIDVKVLKRLSDALNQELAGRERQFTTNPCGYCGSPVATVVTVRRKKYCNHSHRTLAYNARKAQLSHKEEDGRV